MITLTNQELALMAIRAEEKYPMPDVEDSRIMAIRDVRRLLQHSTELQAAAESTNNLYLAEKDRYQEVYRLLLAAQEIIDAVIDLSNVGNIFDGCDHCNEFTHETNYKMLEAALDKIYAIVTGKADE